MDPTALPMLLGLATLLPLASFFILLLFGPRMGKSLGHGAYVAVGAIGLSAVLSFLSLFIWLGSHFPAGSSRHESIGETHASVGAVSDSLAGTNAAPAFRLVSDESTENHEDEPHGQTAGDEEHAEGDVHVNGPPVHYTGIYYLLGQFGELSLSISYYIDSLTIVMFCMVTLIATCIHFYSMGYMHDELHEFTDPEVATDDGTNLRRPGRYHRFFQYLSLFCFSMLGLVLAGNIAMVFVFWELVGICSYFLIGFYIERKSACNAANKAFIVNRVGDFGMIIGLMALWSALGTFNFGDIKTADKDGHEQTELGLFSQVRSGEHHSVQTPEAMVLWAARAELAERVKQMPASEDEASEPGQAEDEIDRVIRDAGPDASWEQLNAGLASSVDALRNGGNDGKGRHFGYGLLIIAGIGIFCGCVGKSAQFPLHVWLPDAMEGPTPVSALVHSATMVAAGVYLVGRFYPVFAPEVLLVIAVIGCITLFLAATIAITATDIKRVLAYSTVSQLGYMMLALGVGGWAAGLLHLVTHAFFKSLLFLCSGSVIHAVHTNEMTEMGGLRKKMPVTAYTMLVGCLAIAGISVPFIVGFSGYYSKDRILEQAFVFMGRNQGSILAPIFFYAAAGGAAITAFYMFRMWFMTFAGKPKNQRRYEHAHESPKVMCVPLIVLAVFATVIAWSPFEGLGRMSDLSLVNMLEASRPAGTLADMPAQVISPVHSGEPMVWPNEHFAHESDQFYHVVWPVTWIATFTAWVGIGLALAIYGLGKLDPGEIRLQFDPIHRFLWNKWWFDELYELIFIRPTHIVSRWIAGFDRRIIDGFIDGLARCVRWFSVGFERVADRTLVDGTVNAVGRGFHALGLWLRVLQTGLLRQYVMFIVIGAVALYVLVSFFWSPTLAG